MDVFCRENHWFMADTYFLAEQIASFGVLMSSVQLTVAAIITLFFMLFANTTLKYAAAYPAVLAWLIIGGGIYTLLILVMMLLNYLASRLNDFNRSSFAEKAKNILTRMLSILFFPLEFLIFEVKCICLVLLVSSDYMQTQLSGVYGQQGFITLLIILVVDFIVTGGLSYFKILFLRQEVPDGSYFSRIPGKFETLYLIAIPFIMFCSLWNNQFAFSGLGNFDAIFITSQSKVNIAFYFTHLAILLILLLVYLYELPYYHSICERYMAHVLAVMFIVQTALGISDYGYRGIAIILCIMVPFQIVFIEIYLEHTYDDKLEFGQDQRVVKLNKIKMILTGHIGGQSKDTLKNMFLKRILGKEERVLSEEAQILDSILKEREATIIGLLKKNFLDTDPIEGTDAQKNLANKQRQRYFHKFDIKDDIYFQMISKYVEQMNYAQMACVIKLEWMLKKKFIIAEILALLNRILLNQETFRSRYICFYALKLTEKKLNFFYKIKESAENGYKDLNNVGLDLDTVLEYKKYMQRLVSSVEKFANLNKKTIQMIMTDGSNLIDIYRQESELFLLSRDIDKEFKMFHSNTLKTEYYHLIPYFYHLMYNTNLYRSSKKIYHTFITRFSEVAKNYYEVNDLKLDNLSVLYYSTTFQCDSDKSTLSLIKDVYGNKSDSYQSCIGKYPEVILPKVQNQYHYQAMNNYMSSDNTTQIKNINIGFTKMPNEHLIVKSVITIKVVPRLKKNFNFMVNLMEKQNPEDYYILVSQNMDIDSYSQNLAKIVDKKLLVTGIPIENVSQRSADFIRRVLIESRQADIKQQYSESPEVVIHSNEQRSSIIKSGGGNNEELGLTTRMVQNMSLRREEFSEDIVFGTTKKSMPKLFHIRIVFNSFKYIAGGYFLLRMRDANSLKLGEIKRRIPNKVVKKVNENFILNFGHAKDFEKTGRQPSSRAQRDGPFFNDSNTYGFEDEMEDEKLNAYKKPFSQKTEMFANLSPDSPYKRRQLAPLDSDKPFEKTETAEALDKRPSKEEKTKTLESLSKEQPDANPNKLSTDVKKDLAYDRDFDNQKPIQANLEHQIYAMEPHHNHSESPHRSIAKSSAEKKGTHRDRDSHSTTEESSVRVNHSGSLRNNKAVLKTHDELKMLTRSSVVSVDASMGYKHNKMVYEDVCVRKIAPAEIKGNRMHLAASLLFVAAVVIAIVMIAYNVNSELVSLKNFYLDYFNYKFLVQRITNVVLIKFGLDTGKVASDRYAFLNCSKFSDLGLYQENTLNSLQSSFSNTFTNLLEVTVQSQASVSSLLFSQNINASSNFLLQMNASTDPYSQFDSFGISTRLYTIFEGLILKSYSKISRMVWPQNSSQALPFYLDTKTDVISDGISYIGQYFLYYDSLNQQPLSNVEDQLTDMLLASEKSMLIALVAIFFSSIFLALGLTCLQILIVRNLSRKIFRMFLSFHMISDLHLKKRLDQLDNIYLLMKDVREINYLIREDHRKENFEGLIKTLKNELPDWKNNVLGPVAKKAETYEENQVAENVLSKRRLKYSKESNFFNLFGSCFAISLQFLVIFCYLILIAIQYMNLINEKQQLFIKENEINQIGLNSAILHNYFLADYFFDSPSLILYNQRAADGIDTFYSKTMSSWFTKVDNIFEVNQATVDSFILDYRDKSSCLIVDSLKSKIATSKGPQLVCNIGSLGILNQSFYSGSVSMYRQFTDFYRSVQRGLSNAEKAAEFGEQRAKEWEVYMAEVYYPTMASLVDTLKSSYLSSNNNADQKVTGVLVLATFLFVIIYAILYAITLSKLMRQINVSRFSFQIFSLKAVLENNKLKARFVEFFGINNREFI